MATDQSSSHRARTPTSLRWEAGHGVDDLRSGKPVHTESEDRQLDHEDFKRMVLRLLVQTSGSHCSKILF